MFGTYLPAGAAGSLRRGTTTQFILIPRKKKKGKKETENPTAENIHCGNSGFNTLFFGAHSRMRGGKRSLAHFCLARGRGGEVAGHEVAFVKRGKSAK